MNTPDNEPTLEEMLAEQRRLLESEFELAQDATVEDLNQIRANAAESFLTAVPKAVKHIIYLMEHAEKDTTQLAAAKYVVTAAFAKDGPGDGGDPLAQLIKGLQKNDNKPQPDRED